MSEALPGAADGARRIESAILNASGPALGVFLTSGFPASDATLPLLHAIDRGGADFIELGMPFSDPLAEGPPIQRSSAVALEGGITMARTFETARQFRGDSRTPLILMGYVNPVFRMGIGNFFDHARSSGVDGVILPDVPLDESEAFIEAARRTGLGFIFMISPTTPADRMKRIGEASSGFVYAVTMTGVTGSNLGDRDDVSRYLERARSAMGDRPLLAGFGIRSHTDVQRVSEHTDGAIVGSAVSVLVEEMWREDGRTDEDRLRHTEQGVERFVHALKNG